GVGSTVSLAGPVVANALIISTGDDADTVTIANATITTTATVNTGAGDDVVTITHAANGSTDINTGDGADAVTVAAGSTLGGGTTNLGTGDDTLTLSSAMNNVNGGDGADLVTLHAGGSIAGTFDGGAGYDQVVYDSDGADGDDYVGAVTVNRQTGVATDVAHFANVERFASTNNAADTLIGANAASTWHITGANAGDIGGAGVFDFVGFGNLTGGTSDDAFQFAAGASLSGDLDGAAGYDTIDYDAAPFGAAATVLMDGAHGGTATGIDGRFDGIDETIGDADFAGDNSLTGYDAANVWTSTGANAGNIDGTFFYQNFGTVNGGGGDENYIIGDGDLPAGPLDGGDGNNVLDLTAWSDDTTWYITGDNAGTVVTPAGSFDFINMTQLLGGDGRDTFIFSDGRILSVGLDGGAGQDTLDLSAYTSENVWTGSRPNGNVATARGSFDYASVENIVAGLVTTFRFSMLDLVGSFRRETLPSEIVQGASGRIDFLLTNQSNARIVTRLNVTFYLSLDETLDGADIQVAQVTNHRVNVFPGRTDVCHATAIVPAGTAPGTYHLLAKVDSADQVDENDELNNLTVADGTVDVLVPTQDLAAVFTRMTLPTNVVPGDRGMVALNVTNNGNTAVTTPVGVDFYLSADGVIDGGDVLLYSVDGWPTGIQPGADKTFRADVVIPDGTPAGAYQVLARVDANFQIAEPNELDNDAMAVGTVNVATPFVDLVLGSGRVNLPGTVVPGDNGSFTVNVQNVGNVPAQGLIDVDVYASIDGVLDGGDTLVASAIGRRISLQPNADGTITIPVTLTSDLLPATYQWLVSIDSGNAVVESNDLNNVQPLVAQGTELVWKFGNFAGRRGVQLHVEDAAGTPTIFSLSGVGVGSVLGGPDFDEIVIVSTNNRTSVRVRTVDGIAQADRITVRQPLGRFYAPTLAVNGVITLDAPVRQFVIANPPTVSILATDPLAAEAGPDTGLFTITRDTITTGDLTVRFALSGRAILNTDYTLSVGGVPLAANEVLIPTGVDHVDILVTPIDDALIDPAENVVVRLLPGPIYVLDPITANTTASVAIADND
ncbi:MAG: CARDB domain-containing protein, partial [Phycisphaerae bacterium]|nr:CARDB domain-containing protein [Phycisphaerae bacterium]